jgi:hypothetical protein
MEKIEWRHNLIPRDWPGYVSCGPVGTTRRASAVPAVALETAGQASGYRWPGEPA